MPDNIWYHDYQIVKVNPPIEIEDGMIADLGDIDEFQEFVKTVSFHKKLDFSLKTTFFQKSADCHYVTYPNQNRKLSKKGKQIKMQTNASKFQTPTVWSIFAAHDVILSGRSCEL